jgi:hypothetical protein
MARITESELLEITRNEVEKYEGTSPHASIYAIMDDVRKRYAITGIENEPGSDHSWIIVQVRIDGDFVIVDEDGIWDKHFYAALEQAGVPREQVILAYKGEQVPTLSE